MSFAERFSDQGWLQVDNVFDKAFIDELRQDFDRQYDALSASDQAYRGYLRVGDERLMLSIELTGPFLNPDLYAQPVLLRILAQFLGTDLLIDSITCVVALPGAGEQNPHRDHVVLFQQQGELNARLPPHAVTAVIPLVDLTPETGTTKLFPGTHRGAATDGFELPYVTRGSCFLMDYRIKHQGTANRSRAQRPVLYLVFSRPWFTDIKNFQCQPRINITPAELRKIPREQWPLFRRLAAKGAMDLSEKELFPDGSDAEAASRSG
jgi:hypothetical protein